MNIRDRGTEPRALANEAPMRAKPFAPAPNPRTAELAPERPDSPAVILERGRPPGSPETYASPLKNQSANEIDRTGGAQTARAVFEAQGEQKEEQRPVVLAAVDPAPNEDTRDPAGVERLEIDALAKSSKKREANKQAEEADPIRQGQDRRFQLLSDILNSADRRP